MLSPQLPQQLVEFLDRVSFNNQFQTAVKKCKEKYNFSLKNIESLNPQKVKILYKLIQSKYQSLKIEKNYQTQTELGAWQENQLRIFCWILVCYLFIQKKKVNQLVTTDLLFLNSIFHHKKIQHLEYQIKLLINKRNGKWKNQESELFHKIMMQLFLRLRSYSNHRKWNFIAKQLFAKSNKKYFKTPKQCRERWLNHLDPTKKKGDWTFQQDLILLKNARNPNRRQTQISRLLQNSRTQNSVKNRFNSLLKTIKKEHKVFATDQQLIKNMILKIESQIGKIQIKNEQYYWPNFLINQGQQKCEYQKVKDSCKEEFNLGQQREILYNDYKVINTNIEGAQEIISQKIQEQQELNQSFANRQMACEKCQYEQQIQNKKIHEGLDEEIYKVIDISSPDKKHLGSQEIQHYLNQFNF